MDRHETNELTVPARRTEDNDLRARRAACLERLERWAAMLDTAVVVPGTRIRFGVDAVLGLLPGIGDLVGVVLGAALVIEALRVRAPKRIWMRMCANVGIDFVIGLIPVVGDVGDVFYRANSRNVRIFRRWLQSRTQP